jgi:hypothetical protein
VAALTGYFETIPGFAVGGGPAATAHNLVAGAPGTNAGNGTISGIVTNNNLPVARKVIVSDQTTLATIAETWSDAETGAYSISGMNVGKAYLVRVQGYIDVMDFVGRFGVVCGSAANFDFNASPSAIPPTMGQLWPRGV